jgi:hypothetical protein
MNDLAKVSKALAGAGAAIVAALLLKYGVVLPAEVNDALVILLDVVIAAGVGYLTVYAAPKNRVL